MAVDPGALGADMTLLRLGVLAATMAPMAVSDWRERSVMQDVMFVCLGASACFLAYDVLSGGLAARPPAVQAGTAAGLAVGAAMAGLARAGLVGTGDAAAVLAVSMAVPAVSGVPVAVAAVILGNAAAALYIAGDSLRKNVADILAGRPYSGSILVAHVKRRGEAFTIAWRGAGGPEGPGGTKRIGWVDGGDGSVRAADGTPMFEDADAEGMEVTAAVPMVSVYFAATLAVAVAAVAAEHVLFPSATGGGGGGGTAVGEAIWRHLAAAFGISGEGSGS